MIAGEGVVSLPPRPAGSPGPPGAGCRGGAGTNSAFPGTPPLTAGPASGEERGSVLVLRQRSAPAFQSSSIAGEASLSLKTADDSDPNLVLPGDVFI